MKALYLHPTSLASDQIALTVEISPRLSNGQHRDDFDRSHDQGTGDGHTGPQGVNDYNHITPGGCFPCARNTDFEESFQQPAFRQSIYICSGALTPINPRALAMVILAAFTSFRRTLVSSASAGSEETTRQSL
jgi:hypothetical protein